MKQIAAPEVVLIDSICCQSIVGVLPILFNEVYVLSLLTTVSAGFYMHSAASQVKYFRQINHHFLFRSALLSFLGLNTFNLAKQVLAVPFEWFNCLNHL